METKTELHQFVPLPPLIWALYDRFGNLPIHGIMKIMWEGIEEAKRRKFPTKLIEKTFIIQEKAIYSPKLHQKDFSTNHDILFHASIGSIGTTSYSVFQDLFDSSTMERLSRVESKMVNIDPETNRPSKLPTVFVAQCSKFTSCDPVLITERQGEITPPKHAFKTMIRTRYNDLDLNMHVNYGEYYGFCADCASEASQFGYYQHYDDDMCQFPVLETDVTFIGESPPCSNLDVYTWQDAANVQIIYFAIYLKSGRIFQAHYLYGYDKSDELIVSKL